MFTNEEQQTINTAISIIEKAFKRQDFKASSSEAVKTYCRLKIGSAERELLGVLFLDTHNVLIEFEVLFSGTIDRASVYIREIIKRALELNAKSIIVCHNHITGNQFPSTSDRDITKAIKESCELLELELLDHIIATPLNSFSFAESGIL